MSIKQIKEKAIEVRNINTNNGWGFGGKMGKEYILPEGKKCFIGQFCYRHCRPSKVEEYYINGVSVSRSTFIESLN